MPFDYHAITNFHRFNKDANEAVRISKNYRGQHLGEWMMSSAMKYGKSKGVSIVQLTTNKKRPRAKQFYEKLGFETTHEGMKLYWKK